MGRLADGLLAHGHADVSFRRMAALADTSVAGLRHYFPTRDDALRAVFQMFRARGAPFLLDAATRPIDDVSASIAWVLEQIVLGWRYGVGTIHGVGLGAGLGHDVIGPVYVDEILEPTLQAVEARIARHVAAGDLGPLDPRLAAIELVSPLLVALLHQNNLRGARCRPLDLSRFLDEHRVRFLRAHAP